jgi:hypothetical protein
VDNDVPRDTEQILALNPGFRNISEGHSHGSRPSMTRRRRGANSVDAAS